MADVVQHVRESGFPFRDEIIHLFVGGSELHGGKVHGTDDLDIYGVYIEPPDMVLGLESFPHFVWSTAGGDRRNRPNDVDVTLLLAQEMSWTGLQREILRHCTSFLPKALFAMRSGRKSCATGPFFSSEHL